MIKVTDSLSGKKESFTPGSETVKMYVCGVTPYDESHIGHAMSYIFFDTFRRYLRYRGYRVKYVQNVTDIDDKLIDRAAKLGTTPSALAEKFTKSYLEDMAALNIEPPDVNPRATGEIAKIIEVVAGLVAKGYAYPAGGSVYFRVRNVPDYGKLSHRSLDSMMAGARIEPGEEKEHPMDFVLWKAAKPGEPSWDSPWGKGRPGWHIECSAMALKYLGESIDIHGGGQDLIFPHHENEIAQSESFTGVKPFARYWMHNGLLQIGDAKMSKSTGNLITIKEILGRHSADTLRLFVLSSTYRSPLTFSEEGLLAAGRGVERLIQTVNRKDGTGQKLDVSSYREQFLEAMDDDFNSARAISSLFDMARAINQAADSGQNIDDALKTLKELAQNVLGLRLEAQIRYFVPDTANLKLTGHTPTIIIDKDASPFVELGKAIIVEIRMASSGLADELEKSHPADSDAAKHINWLIGARAKLRAAKQFKLADEIRKKLLELGVSLEDSPQGTTWKYHK